MLYGNDVDNLKLLYQNKSFLGKVNFVIYIKLLTSWLASFIPPDLAVLES